MRLRNYKDESGREWNVWDVPPRFSPGRSGSDRRTQQQPGFSPERRITPERRRTVAPPEWVYGWVCFQHGDEKLRLCPLPKGWETASDRELDELRRRATPVHRTSS